MWLKNRMISRRVSSIVDISFENKSPIRLAVIYRHPSTTNIEKFLGDFSSCLNEAISGDKTLYLAGDLNINIDRSSRTKTANDFINEMLSYNVIPIITLPTRVTF